MATISVKDGNAVGAIQELFRDMLRQQVVSAILAPQEVPSKRTAIQTLVRDPEELNAVNPLAPVFGVNSARILARMCLSEMIHSPAEPAEETEEQTAEDAAEGQASDQAKEPATAQEQAETEDQGVAEAESPETEQPAAGEDQSSGPPIAVVLRPCEIRSLVELVKLQQASMDPFLVIGVDCWGAYSVEDYAEKADQASPDSSVTADFLQQVTAGNLPEDLRGSCLGCQYPGPTCADVVIQLIGEDLSKEIRVQALTEKGKKAFEVLKLDPSTEREEREGDLSKLKEAKKQLAGQDEPDFREIVSSLCINCHNCQSVCPICYCKQCVFDGPVFEYPLEKYLNWCGKAGVLEMPPDKMLFHLTRMSHVAASCVACGQCEAACPSHIPLGRIYQRISAAAQEALGYEAGRSLDDELPLVTFREDELSVVES